MNREQIIEHLADVALGVLRADAVSCFGKSIMQW